MRLKGLSTCERGEDNDDRKEKGREGMERGSEGSRAREDEGLQTE